MGIRALAEKLSFGGGNGNNNLSVTSSAKKMPFLVTDVWKKKKKMPF